MITTSSSADRFDFSNPFMSALIRTSEGFYPLWIRNSNQSIGQGPQGGKDLTDSIGALSFLAEMVIEVQLAHLPKISLTLTPPYEEAIKFLDSPLMNWGCNIIEAQFGYVSSTTSSVVLSPLFEGVIMKPEVNLGSDISITMTAQGVSSMSASRQEGTRVFNNKSRREIIQVIAEGRVNNPKNSSLSVSKFGSDLSLGAVKTASTVVEGIPYDTILRGTSIPIADVPIELLSFAEQRFIFGNTSSTPLQDKTTRRIEIDYTEVEKDPVTDAKFDEPRAAYAQAGRTDWTAIWELCEEMDCFFVWEGSVLRILPRSYSYADQIPSRHFMMYRFHEGTFGPSNQYFPILSVSSPSMWVFLPGASRNVQVRGTDPLTRETSIININDTTEATGRTKGGATSIAPCELYPAHDEESGSGGKIHPGNPSDPNVVNLAKSEYSKASQQMGVNLTIESLADPKLKPGRSVQVHGLGSRFNGTYVVKSQTFTIGTSGSTMSLDCISNASAISGGIINKGKGNVGTPLPTSEETGSVVKEAIDLGV